MTDLSPALSDEQLAALAQQQDVAAFGSLIEHYETKLLRYIQRISSFRPEEAEEILQEVFLKAWKNIQDFDVNERFSSWIYRITHNETISEFRKMKARGRDQQIVWDEAIMERLPSALDIPAELDQKLLREHVQETLQQLPEKYRNILILFFLEEKKYEEISAILRIPMGTVAVRLNRAKQQLKEQLLRSDNHF